MLALHVQHPGFNLQHHKIIIMVNYIKEVKTGHLELNINNAKCHKEFQQEKMNSSHQI